MPYDNLTTVSSVKSWLKVAGTNDDAGLAALIPVASDLIGRYCGRSNLGAVYSYTENYFRNNNLLNDKGTFDLVLRHYPVTALSSVIMGNAPVAVLNQMTLQSGQAGVFLMEDEEPRVLRFQFLYRFSPVTVVYSAGYAFNQIPPSLAQAANQHVAEIFRSEAWVGKKSVSMLGETTTYDMGESWGMSKRVMAILQPYRDVIPFQGR